MDRPIEPRQCEQTAKIASPLDRLPGPGPAAAVRPTAIALLRTRRFWPLLAAQACGAFNDNLVKNALVVLALTGAGGGVARLGPVVVALAGLLFILPYVLVSATAGALADRRDKAWLIRRLKLAELALVALAAAGLLAGSVPWLLAVLAGLGVQAAFFGPVKYGILPDHLAQDELLPGNGMVEAATFVAILLGTIAGGLLMALPSGGAWVAAAGIAVAAIGIATARAIPPAPPVPDASRSPGTVGLLRAARSDRPSWRAMLAIGWFWTLGALLVSEFPVLAQRTLGGGAALISLLLTAFTAGIGAGALACGRLRPALAMRMLPWAGLALSLAVWEVAAAAAGASGIGSAGAVLGSVAGWRLLGGLLVLAACGGAYSVPLYALIQARAAPGRRARTIAANNIVNAGFMVAGAATAAALAAAGLAPGRILLLAGAANLAILPILRGISRGAISLAAGRADRGLPPPRTDPAASRAETGS